MNVDLILQSVQDFRSQLETWGITNEALWFAGISAAILFSLSLREVSSWYFRVSQVRDEIRELREQMIALHHAQEEALEMLAALQPQPPKAAGAAVESAKAESPTSALFRLDH